MEQEEIHVAIQRLVDDTKRNTARIEKLEKQTDMLTHLVESVARLAEREERVETDVKEIRKDVKSLIEKPSKRVDGIIEKILSVIIAAVVGFILAKIGLQ